VWAAVGKDQLMQQFPTDCWVIAERRGDGAAAPLMVVSDEAQAASLAEDLRRAGQDVEARRVPSEVLARSARGF
jgi:hypothetical protein